MLKAFNPKDSRGRRDCNCEEDDFLCDLDPYEADFLKLLQSKSFRREAFKTQVLSLPENPHIRTRLVHTNEVIALAVTGSEKLGLYTPLCRSGSAGHDIGHTPYGHIGEKVLSELGGKLFRHEVFSVVIAQEIERKGLGLNLSYETLECMLAHSRGSSELTASTFIPNEYNMVMYSDKIAYTFSDLNDALRYGYLTPEKVPPEVNELGINQRQRNYACLKALVEESRKKGQVSFSEGKEFEIFSRLRKFMFEQVYYKVDCPLHEIILKKAYEFFSSTFPKADPIIVTALLTDKEAHRLGELFLTSRKPDIGYIRDFGVLEIIPYLENRTIDYSKADLSWGEQRKTG